LIGDGGEESPLVNSIDENGALYDCIIIDCSYHRNTCAMHALKHLKENGVLILDNANQASVGLDSTATFELLKEYEHYSYSQPGHYDWRTDFWTLRKKPIQFTPEEERLASSAWTDHVKHFAKLFQIQRINSFLEFGVGEGTKYYLDHCGEVTSVELLGKAKIDNLPYYKRFLSLFSHYSNWHPILHICGNGIDQAVSIAEDKHVDPTSMNGEYMQEIHEICDGLFKNKTYDVAFVDSAVIVRGSIVNALFDRVDIIVAHDFNALPDIYGWTWIKTPSNYEQIVFTEGCGTSFWIKKERAEIIEKLKLIDMPLGL
jgi:hypothetical protein